MDQIVQEGGLEYATDVIIHLQQIDIKWDYANNVIIILPSGIAPDYLEQYSRFELRLRKHLSLAEESLAKMCTKTYCRNSTYSRMAATINCFVITRKTRNCT